MTNEYNVTVLAKNENYHAMLQGWVKKNINKKKYYD